MSVQNHRNEPAVSSDRQNKQHRGSTAGESNAVEMHYGAGELDAYGISDEYGGEGYADDCEEESTSYKNQHRSKSILEEDAYPEKTLTTDQAGQCLSRIGQVGDGLMYAYIQIDVDHRNLTDIEEIANFKYLSLVNVSHNRLDANGLNALRHLEHLIVVHADHNVVSSLCLSPMQYLQVLTLNSNRVSSLSGLRQPSLACLELNDNRVCRLVSETGVTADSDGDRCDAIDCPELSTLALSRNALETVEQLAFVSAKLRTLYLSYNKIVSLKGLDVLVNLSRLHLRANRISNLDGFTGSLKRLTYLNLRENRLRDINELDKLVCLKSLKTLSVAGNEFGPVTDKLNVLMRLPWLERIDKETVSQAQVMEAMEYLGDESFTQFSGEEMFEHEWP